LRNILYIGEVSHQGVVYPGEQPAIVEPALWERVQQQRKLETRRGARHDKVDALLSAVEGSAPAPVVEPTAGVFPAGVAGLWSDPTNSPRVTGAFFGVYQASRASFRIYHAAVAFRWGPRWSVTYGQSEIGNLFDTSLTNIDPGLASLQARALWGSFDGTVSWRRLSGSVGIGLAGDDNVGDVQSSTTARVHLRVSPLRGVSIGVRTARAIGACTFVQKK